MGRSCSAAALSSISRISLVTGSELIFSLGGPPSTEAAMIASSAMSDIGDSVFRRLLADMIAVTGWPEKALISPHRDSS